MKKLFLLLLLFTTVINSQSIVTYTPSSALINNPERGLYHFTSTSENGYNLLSASTLNNYRNNENIVVIQRQFFLKSFINGEPITQTYLNNVQTDFNTIRSAGAKVIVRFTYTSTDRTTAYQPTKAQILAHIQQLAPVVNNNKDVIVCIQAGFIGEYGEWYYTNSTEFGSGNYTTLTDIQWNNRKEIMDSMITLFPQEIPLQLRYIYAKQKMYGNSYIGRIGFYNDAFLATYGDAGTFVVSNANSTPSATDINYWIVNTTNLPVTGETNAVNAPRTDCDNTLVEMNRYNWSLLNKDYYPTNISNWQTQNCFTDIQRNLGCRFVLLDSKIQNNILNLRIENVGYANLFKNRKAYLVFKNVSGIDYSFEISNPKQWYKGITILEVPLNFNLPNGTYRLFLNLPDPLNNDVRYSIQTANLGLWTSQGYNDLLQTYVVNNLSVQIFVIDNVVNINNLSNYTFKIYNINGKLLKYNSLNLEGLSSGTYIIKVKSSTGIVYSQKIVKT